MLLDSLRYNSSMCSFRTSVLRLIPPNDISRSQVGPSSNPPTSPGVKGMVPLQFCPLAFCFILITNRIDIYVSHFLMPLRKMTNYNTYPSLPIEPSAPLDPQAYHLNMVQGKRQELLRLEKITRRNIRSTLRP